MVWRKSAARQAESCLSPRCTPAASKCLKSAPRRCRSRLCCAVGAEFGHPFRRPWRPRQEMISVKGLASTLAIIWRLALPYFRSEDRWPGRLLLAAVVAIELAVVAINVILNEWYNRFYNTLQNRDWDAFVSAIVFFCVLAAIFTVITVYQNYLNMWLQIRWRRWMTQTYLRQWLNTANHYRMQLLGDAADNPDQRIADDL